MLGRTGEARAQHRVLRRHPDRAGVEVALAHHDAPRRDQRRGGKAKFIRAEQSRHRDIAPGPQAAIGLHADPAAQVVEQQGLLGFSEPNFPGRPGVSQAGQR